MKTSRPLGLLAALLASGAVLFVGCSQKSETGESKAPATQAQEQAPQAESSAPPAGTVDTLSAPDTSQVDY